jgi:hypothetical protein
MAKYCNPLVIDAALDVIATATKMMACNGQPVSFADANARMLSETSMDGATFSKGDGGISGRRLTVAAVQAVPVSVAGTVNHVALVRVADETLLYVTTADTQQITMGSFVDFPQWSIEIEDPQ